MKIFIEKVVGIVFLFIIAIGVLESVVRNSPNSYSYKNEYIQRYGDRIETVTLGTSHTYAGIDPSCFQSCTFNMANSAQPLKIDYYTLLRYDSCLRNLKTVILDLSYFSLRRAGYDTSEDKYNYMNYNVFMGYKGEEFSVKNSFTFIHAPSFQNYLMNIIRDKNMRCDSLGQGNYYNIKNKKVDTNHNGISESKGHTLPKSKLVDINRDFLLKIAQYCNLRNIRLVIISTPIWCSYYKNMDTEQYNELQTIIKQTQRICAFEYYNFMSDVRFVEDDFMDSHHLSNVGAKKFSLILADTLGL